MTKSEVKSKAVLVVLIISVLLSIGAWGVYVNNTWRMDQDIDSWKNRAQVASNPADMEKYLLNAKSGMIKWGLTTGHAALIFVTPFNDYVLINDALDRTIERCNAVKHLNITSVEYQTALDDIRGQIRELDLGTQGWFVQNAQILMTIWLWVSWAVVTIVFLYYISIQ
jgi:hypothetical protein